jgi:hypothetical protein
MYEDRARIRIPPAWLDARIEDKPGQPPHARNHRARTPIKPESLAMRGSWVSVFLFVCFCIPSSEAGTVPTGDRCMYIGATCEHPDGECNDDTGYICLIRLEAGATCVDVANSFCADGGVCSDTCKVPRALGHTCDPAIEFCLDPVADCSTNYCRTPLVAEDACLNLTATYCLDGLRCKGLPDPVCKTAIALGLACDTLTEACSDDEADCSTDFCRIPLAAGDGCLNLDERYCADGRTCEGPPEPTCKALILVNGLACNASTEFCLDLLADCSTGYCGGRG